MSSIISINPMLVTNAGGLFSVQSDGLVQGVAYDDPSSRNYLAGGYLDSGETLPMWQGVGIQEVLASPGVGALSSPLGNRIKRATALANLTGFAVANQAHHFISTPQSNVPTAGINMSVHFYRFGSFARIALACDPSLISLEGGLVTQQVSWDFNAQRLVPYAPVEGANVITAMSWANTNGGTVTATTTSAHGFVPGNDVTISGVTPAAYNGDVTLLAGTTGSTLVYALPEASTPGSVTTQGQVNAAGGALGEVTTGGVLPVRVLEVQATNCKVIAYDAVNNLANWDNDGACAVVLI